MNSRSCIQSGDLHDGSLQSKTPCQRTAGRVGVTISLTLKTGVNKNQFKANFSIA